MQKKKDQGEKTMQFRIIYVPEQTWGLNNDSKKTVPLYKWGPELSLWHFQVLSATKIS